MTGRPFALAKGEIYRTQIKKRGPAPSQFKLIIDFTGSGFGFNQKVWFVNVTREGKSKTAQYWSRVVFERRVIGGPYALGAVPFEEEWT